MDSRLGDRCVAYRLDGPPVMVAREPPVVAPAFAEELSATRAEMAGGDTFFDGQIGVPTAVRGAEVYYHRATYAWHLTERRGTPLPEGRGLIAVALVLQRPDGRVLWQRRAAHLPFGGIWDVSAAGSWHPGEDSIEAAYREAVEELGVGRDRLGRTREAWLVVGPPPRGVTVVVRAEVDEAPEVRPDPHEVDRVVWAHRADDLPGEVWAPRRTMLAEVGFPWPAGQGA